MKKLFYTLVAVLVVGCGESQLDRRARLEEPEQEVKPEEIQADEETVKSDKEPPKAPQTNQRTDSGQRPSQGQRPSRGRGLSALYEQLGLSEEQQGKLEAVNQARREEMSKVMGELRNGGGDREAMMAKFRELGEKYQKQIDAILTDEQKKKMAQLREQQPQGGRSQGGRGQSSRGSRNSQFASLGVNDDQQKKLDTARQALSAQMREVFSDRDMSREDRERKRAEVSEAYEAKLKDILNEEQYEKWQEQRTSNNRRPNQGAQGQGRRPGEGGQSQGRRPGQGGQSQGRRPGQGGQSQGRQPGQGGQGPGGRPQPEREN